MRSCLMSILLLTFVVTLFTSDAAGQQPDRAPLPGGGARQLAAPSQPPTLATVFAAHRRVSCRPAASSAAAGAEGTASCAPSDAWTCPTEVELRRTNQRPETCAVQCTLASASPQCECTINLSSCKQAN